MKNLTLGTANLPAKGPAIWLALLTCVLSSALAEDPQPAEKPAFGWGLFWGGSWEETETLSNRGDLRLTYPALGLMLRGQVLDRRPLDFDADPVWGDGSKEVSNFSGGLYHQPTGSRLLYGVLDEWGLSARTRNPWIRAAPFAENHKPLIADMRTTVSATKEPEAYLYLSSPMLQLLPEMNLRAFALAQTSFNQDQADGLRAQQQLGEANTLPTQPKADGFRPDLGGGLEMQFGSGTRTGTAKTGTQKTSVLLEGFYTGAELPEKKRTSWFADPPPLPARDFNLYGAGLLINAPLWALSSDLAWSETFAVGKDFYGNVGIRLNQPPTLSDKKPGPWSLSLAADGAGEHFTGRDGSNHGAGFRTAGKLEWKGKRSSLFRITSTLRGPGIGEEFNRSSSSIYYRFASPLRGKNAKVDTFPLRLTRLSFGADRNATNPEKILDSIDGTVGLSLSLQPLHINSPLGINLSGSLKGLCSAENPQPFPSFNEHEFSSTRSAAELNWSPGFMQFRTKVGYTETAKKDGLWDTSFTITLRGKPGRFSVKAASADFPFDWKYTLSWHLEKK